VDSLIERLAALRYLPAMPHVLARLISLLEDEEHEIDEVGRAVAMDRSLSLAVLRAANSGALGAVVRIDSVKDAATRLGAQHMLRITLSQLATELLARGGRGYGLEARSAWEGALAGGLAAEILARRCAVSSGTAMTCSLLRDCGKLAMDELCGVETMQRTLAASPPGSSQLEIERQMFGCDHAEVGELLARGWGLGPEIELAVRWHHEPSRAGDSRLVDVVYTSEVVASQLGYGIGLDGLAYGLDEAALARLGIDRAVLCELMADTSQALQDLVAVMREP
jgi:HD-like signal output (HDOD) protein